MQYRTIAKNHLSNSTWFYRPQKYDGVSCAHHHLRIGHSYTHLLNKIRFELRCYKKRTMQKFLKITDIIVTSSLTHNSTWVISDSNSSFFYVKVTMNSVFKDEQVCLLENQVTPRGNEGWKTYARKKVEPFLVLYLALNILDIFNCIPSIFCRDGVILFYQLFTFVYKNI